MGLINPKPRFAFDPATGLVYDYVTGRDVPLTETYQAHDGVWDLKAVADAIMKGVPIDMYVHRSDAPAAQAQDGAQTAGEQPVSGQLLEDAAGPLGGLTAPQLRALALSPLQAGMLGLTAGMLAESGISATHLHSLNVTAERAAELQLSPEQAAALAPPA